MEPSKKSVYYRLEADSSVEAKKQILHSTISSIEMLKIATQIEKLKRRETESINEVQNTIKEITRGINEFMNALPSETEEKYVEPKSKKGKKEKSKGMPEKITQTKQFEEELKDIKTRLARIS